MPESYGQRLPRRVVTLGAAKGRTADGRWRGGVRLLAKNVLRVRGAMLE